MTHHTTIPAARVEIWDGFPFRDDGVSCLPPVVKAAALRVEMKAGRAHRAGADMHLTELEALAARTSAQFETGGQIWDDDAAEILADLDAARTV